MSKSKSKSKKMKSNGSMGATDCGNATNCGHSTSGMSNDYYGQTDGMNQTESYYGQTSKGSSKAKNCGSGRATGKNGSSATNCHKS